jgi:hypothetical protein
LNLPVSHVQAALRYFAEYTDEIDRRIAANDEAAERELRLWEAQRALIAR